MKAIHLETPTSVYFSSFCILWNLLSSISIVMLNKWIFFHYRFPSITLTFIHFVMTSIGLQICAGLNLFNKRSLQLRSMLPLSVSFCGFVVLTNMSLQYNTIGTYQLIKVLTTPCIMIIEYWFYKKTYQLNVIFTLIPITIGIFLNCYYDVQLNITGFSYALAGVVVTSLYQIWVGQTQRDLNVDSIQLLNYQAPLSAAVLLFIIPWFEPVFGTFEMICQWPLKAWILLFLSGFIAFFINMTIFWIIGNTSPVTYNMVGHLKFCLTLAVGYLLFHAEVSYSQVVGVFITLCGILVYSHLKLKDLQKKTPLSRNV